MRHRTDMPDVVEDGSSVAREERGKFAVVVPCTSDGAFVDRAAAFVEEQRLGGIVSVRAVQSDVPLALLFGIVERMRVQERPHELAADILKPKLEMRMLV